MNRIPNHAETAQELRRALKAERMTSVRRATLLAKQQNAWIRQITAALAAGPQTVPEIAEATAIPAPEALRFVMTLRKYGSIVEAEKVGTYYRYALAAVSADAEQSREAA